MDKKLGESLQEEAALPTSLLYTTTSFSRIDISIPERSTIMSSVCVQDEVIVPTKRHKVVNPVLCTQSLVHHRYD